MSESTSAGRADKDARSEREPRARAHRGAWIPNVAALLCLLIGLNDVLAVLNALRAAMRPKQLSDFTPSAKAVPVRDALSVIQPAIPQQTVPPPPSSCWRL